MAAPHLAKCLARNTKQILADFAKFIHNIESISTYQIAIFADPLANFLGVGSYAPKAFSQPFHLCAYIKFNLNVCMQQRFGLGMLSYSNAGASCFAKQRFPSK